MNKSRYGRFVFISTSRPGDKEQQRATAKRTVPKPRNKIERKALRAIREEIKREQIAKQDAVPILRKGGDLAL